MHVRPELVVEIALDGVQVSRRYPGGVALRFARVRRYRPDKAPADADTIDTVRALPELIGEARVRAVRLGLPHLGSVSVRVLTWNVWWRFESTEDREERDPRGPGGGGGRRHLPPGGVGRAGWRGSGRAAGRRVRLPRGADGRAVVRRAVVRQRRAVAGGRSSTPSSMPSRGRTARPVIGAPCSPRSTRPTARLRVVSVALRAPAGRLGRSAAVRPRRWLGSSPTGGASPTPPSP